MVTAIATVLLGPTGAALPNVVGKLETDDGMTLLMIISNADGYDVFKRVPLPFDGLLKLQANGADGKPYAVPVHIPDGAVNVSLRVGGVQVNPQDIVLPAAIPFKQPSPMPAPPTRDHLCAVKMSFQGLTFSTPTYGSVLWWETLAWWPARTDRDAAYAAKRAAGDTHAILDLSGSYKELGDVYDQVGADYSQNLAPLVALAEEAIKEGFLVDLRLAGDGQGAGPGYNDPVGMTYGHDWLMANFPRIAAAFAHLERYIVFVPGYDGVFYGWEPEQVVAFGKLFRSVLPDGTLGIEFNTGHIPLGEGPGYQGAYAPGGCMQDYDVIYGEFDPFNYHADSSWQICGRLVEGYVRPPDQPAGDDPHPPYLLGTPNARGPWFFIAFEILTYVWVRGQTTPADIAAYRAYFAAMGCRHIC